MEKLSKGKHQQIDFVLAGLPKEVNISYNTSDVLYICSWKCMYIVLYILCYCGWNISREKLNKESCQLRFSTFSGKTQARWSLLCSEQPTFNMLRKSQWFSQFSKTSRFGPLNSLTHCYISSDGIKNKVHAVHVLIFSIPFRSNELCIFTDDMKHMLCLGLPLINIQGSRIVA